MSPKVKGAGVLQGSSAGVNLDPERMTVKVARIGPIVVLACTVVVFYLRMDYAIDALQKTTASESMQRARERENIVTSVNEVRDELRKVFIDTVLTRQAQSWIELARALNKDKFPNLIWPDLPR